VLQIGRSLVRSQLVSFEFFIYIKAFRSHWVDSASNRNEYQEFFLGGKSGRCVRLTTYHHPVPLSRNLRTLTSWNPLGHSRPVTGLLYLFTSSPCKLHFPPSDFILLQGSNTLEDKYCSVIQALSFQEGVMQVFLQSSYECRVCRNSTGQMRRGRGRY